MNVLCISETVVKNVHQSKVTIFKWVSFSSSWWGERGKGVEEGRVSQSATPRGERERRLIEFCFQFPGGHKSHFAHLSGGFPATFGPFKENFPKRPSATSLYPQRHFQIGNLSFLCRER